MGKTMSVSVGSVVILKSRGRRTRAVVVAVSETHFECYVREGMPGVSRLPIDRKKLRPGHGWSVVEGERGDVDAERAHLREHLAKYPAWRANFAAGIGVGF